MKIIIGSESFAPTVSGVASATELLARTLAKAGHKVAVFVPSTSRKSYLDKTYHDFSVYRFRSIESPFRKGTRVTILPGKAIQEKVAKIKPDIIHLQDPTSICSQLLKVAKEMKIPVVITNHFGLDYAVAYIRFLKPFHAQIREILKLYLSGFYNQCDYVTCPTELVKDDLINWGVKSPIFAVSNGIDLDRFFVPDNFSEISKKFHLPTRSPKVLYVGRLDRDKQIDVLVNAIPKVLSKTKAHFVIVGMGEEVKKLKKLAKKLGVEKNITWTGWLEKNSELLIQMYKAGTVFAIPAAMETQSIVTMEAMAAGLPIVGANSGAIPELVKDGKNGLLFKPGDSEDMADKILKILKNKKIQEDMGRSSLELISAHQMNDWFEEIMKIYEKLYQR